MDLGSTWQTMPPCHFRRHTIENRSRVFIAKKFPKKALCFCSGVTNRVLDKFRQSKFAPVGTLDLGPHCGPKSSVNRVNVMSALPPKAAVGVIEF